MTQIKTNLSTKHSRVRGWARFSLRFMLIVVTIICVWLGVLINRAAKQKEIVNKVTELGGHVVYDYQLVPTGNQTSVLANSSLMNPDAKSPVSNLAVSVLGIDFFHKPVWVNLVNKKPMQKPSWSRELNWSVQQVHGYNDDPPNPNNDAAILEDICQGLPGLESLVVAEDLVTNQTLHAIAKLPKLKRLEIIYPRELTDEGIVCLEDLHHLEELRIKGAADLSDQSLTSFAQLKNLEILEIPWGDYSDQGVRCLERLKKLRHLDFPRQSQAAADWHKYGKSPRSIKLTDEALKSLSKLERLERLSIYSNQFTEQGIKYLANINSLCELKIGGFEQRTSLSLAGMSSFENNQNLEFLDLTYTQMSFEDSKELERRMPLCRVLVAAPDLANGQTQAKQTQAKQTQAKQTQAKQAEAARRALMEAMRNLARDQAKSRANVD